MKKIIIKDIVRPNVGSLRAYEAKEIPCKVKLDANESPYAADPKRVARSLNSIKTNRYPDPEAKKLRQIVAEKLGLPPENILQGNGSDELIYYLVTTFGGPVLYPVPTFSMYGIISTALGEKTISIPLDEEFDIDLSGTISAVKKYKPKLIFLSSPNNPTGNCYSAEKILKIIELSKGIVVVDEAYQPFSSEMGFLPFLKDYNNLVIMRTLSKIGMAALRLGFLIASGEIINEVNKVRLPFNVNSLSQTAAMAVLSDWKALNASIGKIVSERDRLFREMKAMPGVRPFPSEANFVLIRVNDPDKVYASLLEKGVLVRNLGASIKGCLRVTVGDRGENTTFLKALKQVVGGK